MSRRSSSLASIVIESPISSSNTILSPKTSHQRGSGDSVGSISLNSPDSQSSRVKFEYQEFPQASGSTLSSKTEDPHAYRKPDIQFDSRCPCPALNTLANHGYLPRDGKNITLQQLLDALQHPETYNLSSTLANTLARGGEAAAATSIHSFVNLFIGHADTVTIRDLGRHDRVEHNASMVHKDTPAGKAFGPIRTDTMLLNEFLGDSSTIELADIARRRVALERASHLHPIHAETARGEWALVLGIFGHAHAGKIPADELRVWLSENRFPDNWKSTHKQTLEETITTSRKIYSEMQDLQKHHNKEWTAEDERNKGLLTCNPEEAEALN